MENSERKAKMRKNQIEKFKKTCEKYLIMRNTDHIDIIFGTIMANRLDSKPVWLYLVGPPSSGKTEILQALPKGKDIYPISRITTSTLVSDYVKLDKKGNRKDPSLLPLLHNKTLVIKDFTAMLTLPAVTLHTILGQMRDAFDGKLDYRYGTGDEFNYKSKFGCIAAVTTMIDKQKGVLAELGERFLTFRMPVVSSYESDQRALKAMNVNSVIAQENALGEAAQAMLDLEPEIPVIDRIYQRQILRIAAFTAVARCEIFRNPYTKDTEPFQPEESTRLAKQLHNLAIGIAMARQKRKVDEDDVRLVHKTAIDCMTLKRIQLVRALLSAYPDYVTVQDVSDAMLYPYQSVRRYVDDLMLLGMLDRRIVSSSRGTPVYMFRVKEGKMLMRVLDPERLEELTF
jgi:predicted transcriptional regulator